MKINKTKFYLTGNEKDIVGLDMSMIIPTMEKAQEICNELLTTKFDPEVSDGYEIIYEVKPVKIIQRITKVTISSEKI